MPWFVSTGRSFPWRETRDPYGVLVAEILLQLTISTKVVAVYRRLIKAYPKVEDLSRAEIADLEDFVRPLGLIQRAARLKRLAEIVVDVYNGALPIDASELLTLPGVGPYIADAVSCFSHGRSVILLDSVSGRVYRRLFGLTGGQYPGDDSELRESIRDVPIKGDPRAFNYAILDLAALICRPKRPRCSVCPLHNICCFRSES